MVAETCYPVKVSHGHARLLMGKTRFLFLPTLIDMPTPEPAERGYYCPMVQSNAYMVRAALGIPEAGRPEPDPPPQDMTPNCSPWTSTSRSADKLG